MINELCAIRRTAPTSLSFVATVRDAYNVFALELFRPGRQAATRPRPPAFATRVLLRSKSPTPLPPIFDTYSIFVELVRPR